MKYSELADVYEKLENTSARLKKTDIIAELLKKTPTHELEKLVLLLSGRIFPIWSEEETGVANQIMIQAIAKSSGIDGSAVNKAYKKIGDLGKVAEEFCESKKQKTLFKKTLDIDKVYENMLKIASQGGKGSQDRKISLIVELLSQSNSKEAKYIVRIVLEELRIGVAEGVIRDSIAKAFGVNKKIVEDAWFLRPDYGIIAEIAKEKGERGLKMLEVEIGVPIKVQLAERSPNLKTALESFENPTLECKYDGMRTIIEKDDDKIWIFTRRMENVSSAFPDLVELCKKYIKAKRCIIDGETIAIDPKNGRPLPFQKLSERIKRKYNIHETIKEIPIQINLFDIIYLDEKKLFDLPLYERREILKNNIKIFPDKFQIVKSLTTNNLKLAENFYKEALQNGHEGLIVKNLEAKYVSDRRVAGGWLKVKPIMETLDLVITGATWGAGKRTGWFGSFMLSCRNPKTGEFLECGMLGTGIKEKKSNENDITFDYMTKLLKPYIEHEQGNQIKIKPKIVIEVAYEEIQKSPTYKSKYALRFPRFIRLRHTERSAEEADTINRVEHLYRNQKGKK
ncbi:MAG: ATP-dependent DNA ligase [Nanoarchaeota archaeon]|nr:ATP-dependent DNA ligase [Nanoarchaeota archaeon]MBU4124023.1 ATP-dependent DNA ligase [Nanoarchaeota archaeon]